MDDAVDRITERLRRTLDGMEGDIERVELLSAALAGFSRPVPSYEPAFHHLHATSLDEHRLGGEEG